MNDKEHCEFLELKLEKMKLELKIKDFEKEIEHLKCEIRRLKSKEPIVWPVYPGPGPNPCPNEPIITFHETNYII